MTILLLDSYFRIKVWIYRGILEVLVKNSLNLISTPLILLNFEGMKNLSFKGIERNECSFLPISFPPT